MKPSTKYILSVIGKKRNDNIYLSVNFYSLALSIKSGHNRINKNLVSAIKYLIGKKGNIFVPTYSFTFKSYKNKFIYDLKKTTPQTGEFPKSFLKFKNVIRSKDPIVSIAGFGPKKNILLSNKTHRSYGPGTFWDKFLKLDNSKILNIGLGPHWFPFIHQAEYKAKVSYRKNLTFYGFIKNGNKNISARWIYYARKINSKQIMRTDKIGAIIEKKGLIKNCKFSRTKFFTYNASNVFDEIVKILKRRKKILIS